MMSPESSIFRSWSTRTVWEVALPRIISDQSEILSIASEPTSTVTVSPWTSVPLRVALTDHEENTIVAVTAFSRGL